MIDRVVDFSFILIFFGLAIHTVACIWILIGFEVNGGWIDVSDSNDQDEFFNLNQEVQYENIYIGAIYWMVTTLATVGYGDFKGYTPYEYLFTLFVEFLGIIFFTFFMGKIQGLMAAERGFEDIVESKIVDLEKWLLSLDQARKEEHIPEALYFSIHKFVSSSINGDFNTIIEGFPFYDTLKPSLKYDLCEALFGDFAKRFETLFLDLD